MSDILNRNRGLLITVALLALLLIWMSSQYEPRVTASIVLSALTLGALYFLVASGLSLIFGLMDVLNFAHGLFFMLGAYAGYTLYANPRMILNSLPFVLAFAGGTAVTAWVGRTFLSGALSPTASRVLTGAVWGVALALVVLGLNGFDLLVLAASAATSAGGAVPTEVAQEAAGPYTWRLVWLALAGAALGLLVGRRQIAARRRTTRAWLGPLLGVLAIALALAMVPVRASGETAILEMSSNVRFLLALAFGAASGAALGGLVELGMIRPLYSRPIYQVLLTLGLVFVGTELIRGVWGPAGFYMDIPAFFNTRGENCPSPDIISWFSNNCASIMVVGRPFPSYRIFIILLGIVMFVAIFLLLRRTRMGMIIRAGVQDSDMVQALGINVRRVFTLVFALGTGLAALGGVAAAPFVGVNPGLGQEFLLLAFIAVVIGGMGSYTGAAIGALLVGLARAFGDQLVLSGIQLPGMEEALKLSPSIARASTVLLMAAVLLIRPAGLFGKKE
ncbi:MAG TPA: branched-chain amino acid ABC transporter permease [Chloroflexia bacterium]|nr:branched-chain amino acid ABC transporter permease [Chloroflexia bacterium]